MNEYLNLAIDSFGFGKQVSEFKKVTTYCYKPKNAKERKAIMEGNYPDGFNAFIIFLEMGRNKGKIHFYRDSVKWIQKESYPHLLFEVEEYNV